MTSTNNCNCGNGVHPGNGITPLRTLPSAQQEATGTANARHFLRELYTITGFEFGGCHSETVHAWTHTDVTDEMLTAAADWGFVGYIAAARDECWDWTDGWKIIFEYDPDRSGRITDPNNLQHQTPP